MHVETCIGEIAAAPSYPCLQLCRSGLVFTRDSGTFRLERKRLYPSSGTCVMGYTSMDRRAESRRSWRKSDDSAWVWLDSLYSAWEKTGTDCQSGQPQALWYVGEWSGTCLYRCHSGEVEWYLRWHVHQGCGENTRRKSAALSGCCFTYSKGCSFCI